MKTVTRRSLRASRASRARGAIVLLALALWPGLAAAAPPSETWNARYVPITAADFDGDAELELFVSGLSAAHLVSPASGAVLYSFPSGYGQGPQFTASLFENLDADPAREIVLYVFISQFSHTRFGLFEHANGSYGATWERSDVPGVTSLRAADLTGSGSRDLVAVKPTSLLVLDRASGVTLYDWSSHYSFTDILSVQILDLDGDGADEILVHASHSGEQRLHVIEDPGVTLSTGPARLGETGLAMTAGPNPFEGPMAIDFALPAPGRVQVQIYDAAGRRVRALLDEPRTAGQHRLRWDGRDEAGRAVSSGAYFCEVRSGEERVATQVVRIR